jgi:pseudouridine kinase
MGIVVIGAVFVDIKGFPDGAFIPTGKNAGSVEQVHGGVSRNVCEDISNIELRPTFVGVVDDTAISDEVINKLKRHKVNTKYIRREKDGLGTWLAIFDPNGDVFASISKRPNLDGIAKTLDEKGDEIFSNCDAIAIEIDMEPRIIKRILYYARKYHKAVYAVPSNAHLANDRRDFIKQLDCYVCNDLEAGLFFAEDFSGKTPEEMVKILKKNVALAKIPRMVVTMGGQGSVYATCDGEAGIIPPAKVHLVDTTGCGDAYFAGVCAGLTYGKNLEESCQIGTRLAASVISSKESVCPRFLPSEFELDVTVED